MTLPPPTADERARELCARWHLRCAVIRQHTLARVRVRLGRTEATLRRAAARVAVGGTS